MYVSTSDIALALNKSRVFMRHVRDKADVPFGNIYIPLFTAFNVLHYHENASGRLKIEGPFC